MSDATRGCSFLLEPWLELHDLIAQHPHLRRVFFDPVTGLPTAPLLFPRIESLLEECGEISLVCLNVMKYSKIEEIYGWEVFDEVMREVAASLERITGFELRDTDIVAELMISGTSFVVLLSPPRTTSGMQCEALDALARRIETRVREDLASVLDPAIFPKFGCYAGAATAYRDDNMRLERLLHVAIEAALADSDTRECSDGECRKRRLEQIIQAGDVRTLVHPIYDLKSLDIIGYEALSRGPEASEFERPDKLFKIAYDSDLVLKLERLCRSRALQSAVDLPPGRLLFVNIEPEAVADPELRDIMLSSVVAESNMSPSQIVLEITERAAIEDFGAFRATLEYLRALGFRIAVDDGGGGYGSMQCIEEVHPEWLKVDMSLVRDLDTDDVRRALVSAIAMFAERTGVKVIAEGIESVEQLAVLREIGVEYGQGYLFCKPQVPFPADVDVTPDI
ncbi:MAG: bifunctional diguanylate cyclase/phosphodiesterase [Coriobacteriia bacterium]|nr:bifunctional diguanylate cyclase/phosphodiesterase [Coriobacteriia bacterium]